MLCLIICRRSLTNVVNVRKVLQLQVIFDVIYMFTMAHGHSDVRSVPVAFPNKPTWEIIFLFIVVKSHSNVFIVWRDSHCHVIFDHMFALITMMYHWTFLHLRFNQKISRYLMWMATRVLLMKMKIWSMWKTKTESWFIVIFVIWMIYLY